MEFAVVGLVMYLLLAATLTFGHLLFCAQTVQQVADVAAREIAHTPLAQAAAANPTALYTLNDVLYGDAVADPNLASVRTRIFDERYLVLTIDPTPILRNGTHVQWRAPDRRFPPGHAVAIAGDDLRPDQPGRSDERTTDPVAPLPGRDVSGLVGLPANARHAEAQRIPGANPGRQHPAGIDRRHGQLVAVPHRGKRRSPAGYGRWNRSSTRPGKTPFR